MQTTPFMISWSNNNLQILIPMVHMLNARSDMKCNRIYAFFVTDNLLTIIQYFRVQAINFNYKIVHINWICNSNGNCFCFLQTL